MTKDQIEVSIATATVNGYIPHLKNEVLTEENILTVGIFADDEAIIHDLAWRGHLQHLPLRFLTVDNLLIKNASGETVLDIVCNKSYYPDRLLGIPMSESCKEVVDEDWWLRNLRYIQETDYSEAEYDARRSSDCLWAPEALNDAIRMNVLACLKDVLLTEENFNTFDTYDNTALMTAAFHGHLDQVPTSILSETNLLLSMKRGISALSRAAIGDNLDQLLGVELSEISMPIVGDEWWYKNQKFIKAKTNAKAALIKPIADDHDIELF